MFVFTARRLGVIAVQIFVTLTAVFVLFRIAPGDPAALILGSNATHDQINQLREQLGLNDPIFVQFGRYLADLLHGDLGMSTSYAQPVGSVIGGRVGATIALLGVSLLMATTIGVAAGVLSAIKPRSFFARSTLLLWVLLLAVPNFWLGMILIQFFAVKLQWFPAIGADGTLATLILPAAAVAARLVALIARLTRANMLETLGENFIQTALARGVSPARLVLVHALKPSAPAILTMIGLQAGYLLGGSVVVENLFSYPGMGQLLLSAVSQRDYVLMQGITILFVAGFLVINLTVDVIATRLDPRLRAKGADS